MVRKAHRGAERDFLQSLAYYDSKSLELGDRFMAAFEHAVAEIQKDPERWPMDGNKARRCELDRFPFGVIYVVRGEILHIVALAHHKRRPNYWRKRLKDIEDN